MKDNKAFYLYNQAFYNPEHIEASYKAWDAIPDTYKGALESQDIYRENYYLSYDKSNPDRQKNAPANSPEWQAQAAKAAKLNEQKLEAFWETLESDTPWGGHKRSSGDIKTVYGKVTYITEDELPEIFSQTIMGRKAVSHHDWNTRFFYARDEAGRPFRQAITSEDRLG